MGGRQLGVSSIRYQAAFAGYAFAALGQRTPAYPVLAGAGLSNAIALLLDRNAWAYVPHYWKDKPWFPDPVAEENIMYSGHLLQLLVLYETLTGDDRFRRDGFDLVWDETTRFHYTTLTLAETIVRQMRRNACGGVACEPGLVFFPCNNHPQLALLMMERLGWGDWQPERRKWEAFALDSFGAQGGGAIKLLYHMPSRAFVPGGHPGLDAWSLLWYQPWASDPGRAEAIWERAARHVDWARYTNLAAAAGVLPPRADASCCHTEFLPEPVVASFLYPAALACGDPVRAAALKSWLDRYSVIQTNGLAWLEQTGDYRIGATANMALGELLAGGSDLRALVQRPLPPSYWDGPFIIGILPDNARVYRAYRAGRDLVVDLAAPGEVRLELAHADALALGSDEGHTPAWRRDGRMVILSGQGRRQVRFLSSKEPRGSTP